ncbi:hypothetical protein GMRT_12781 [Giardia muris]|uniref:Tail specific protease domain-containing protein n=1 Tax=Giardia muris TaxID=5742 RepID=A0A4Z1T3M7_GIAMU|nr:hypothetical protein GMRT_12781 [Giardia muris]|eukprot:TNJ27139.1 hypothetical protein GMRT_12781 [Giardia muris]
MLLLGLGLAAALVLAGDCRMLYARTLYPIASARGCLEAPLLTEEVFYGTQDTLTTVLPMYVFLDVCKRPPDPYSGLAADPETRISGVFAEYASRINNASAWEFHEALASIFRDLKDAHTLYVKPSFFGHFRLAFPYSFEVKGGDVYLAGLSPDYAFITESYIERYGEDLTQRFGQRLVAINDTDPLEYLTAWAKRYVYATKSTHGQLNSLLAGDFMVRSLKVFGLPDPADENVVLELANGETLVIRFSIYSDREFNSEEEAIRLYMSNVIDPSEFTEIHPFKEAQAPLKDHRPTLRFFTEELDRSAIGSSKYKLGRALSEHFQPSHEYADHVRSARSGANYRYVIGDDSFSLYRYTTPQTQVQDDVVYVLAVYSFMPDDMVGTMNNMVDALEHLREVGVTRLIISLNGNGGGWVTLGHLLARALFPTSYPIYGAYNVRVNRLLDTLVNAKSIYTWMHRVDPWTGANLTYGTASDSTAWYYEDRETYDYIDDVVYGSARKVRFTRRFSFDDDLEDDISEGLERMYKFPGLDLSPDRVAIVTDGNCGSTCASFAKHLIEDHRCMAIGLGGSTEVDDPYDVASFSGGTVDDTTRLQVAILPLLWQEDVASHLDNVALLKKVFMPTDAYFRYSFHQLFSWNMRTHPVGSYAPLEYVPTPVHKVLPIYPIAYNWQGLDGIDTFMDAVYEEMLLVAHAGQEGNCLPGFQDVRHFEDGVAGADCPLKGNENGRGIYDCNGTCAFYDCAEGYYIEPRTLIPPAFRTCEPRVDSHAWDMYVPPPFDHSLHFAHILLLLLTLATVVTFVYVVLSVRKPELMAKFHGRVKEFFGKCCRKQRYEAEPSEGEPLVPGEVPNSVSATE